LPEEYEKCLVGLTEILRKTWNTSYHTEDKREKIQALSLAKDCYSMKLDLLTNATIVDDAIRFVTQKAATNAEPKAIAAIVVLDGKKEKHQEDQKQEPDNSSTTTSNINQVF
jgi:hypothetical protein